jgi:hypothetical protein
MSQVALFCSKQGQKFHKSALMEFPSRWLGRRPLLLLAIWNRDCRGPRPTSHHASSLSSLKQGPRYSYQGAFFSHRYMCPKWLCLGSVPQLVAPPRPLACQRCLYSQDIW